MGNTITLLTEEQAREIAEQSAAKAVELLISKLEPKQEESSESESEIMTIKDAAKYLKCSAVTVYRKIKKDGLPVYYRLGHPRLIKSEIDEWLKDNDHRH
ncbi:MAG TPA: helix-turn-helix domain-containing protein [Pyrinomonadaceae bacterium]|jgi:excisionase family DNA binding protein